MKCSESSICPFCGGNVRMTVDEDLRPLVIYGMIEFPALSAEYKYDWLVILLFMHKTMKDIRNIVNHAAEESQYHQDAIKRAINYYVWLVEKLTEDIKN